jgi:hypothetical protein
MKKIVKLFGLPLSFFLLLFVACSTSSENQSYNIETDNGVAFEVKTIGPSLIIFSNGKPLVGVVDSGNSLFIETFANGMASIKVGYKKDEYEPTSMALALGTPEASKLIIYGSNGHVKQEINNVNKFLDEIEEGVDD